MSIAAPYGSWKSPITAELITEKVTSLLEVAVDGDDIYWLESRPKEGGRYTIMRWSQGGKIEECTPPDYYVRTTVHEYGGAPFTVADGVLYFANYQDQRLYRQKLGRAPEVLTQDEGCRYADVIVDRKWHRLICIREDHTTGGEAVNTIVSVDLKGGGGVYVLVEGNHFYSSPRLSDDGTRLAFLTWNHPNMPWDGCELWVANVAADGRLDHAERVIGGPSESVFQPEWSPDGVLHFVVESSGWWNLYRWDKGMIEALYPMQAEFGLPQWVFGMSTYGFASATRVLCCYSKEGIWSLAWLDTAAHELTPIESPYTDIGDIHMGKGFAVLIAGSPTQPASVIRMDTGDASTTVLMQAFEVTVDPGYLSIPESIAFPTDGGQGSHGIYYPPRSKDYVAPQGERPPLLVISHGGPTGAASTLLRYSIQFWTSRGFAVLDVNYGGSTGYGRDYRQRLNGNWGVVDVADCCNGALYLVDQGLADRDRLAIRGSSAGGYTTLACLTFRNEVFKAGSSHYGLSELEVFARDTHKFESRYLTSLIGPYPARKELYFQRSPINFLSNLSAPLILFQGDEDKIVPPSQSKMMFDAVRSKGIPVAYLLFQGEQHGFRRAGNIRRSLEAELYFYSKVFHFELPEPLDPVEIQNL